MTVAQSSHATWQPDCRMTSRVSLDTRVVRRCDKVLDVREINIELEERVISHLAGSLRYLDRYGCNYCAA